MIGKIQTHTNFSGLRVQQDGSTAAALEKMMDTKANQEKWDKGLENLNAIAGSQDVFLSAKYVEDPEPICIATGGSDPREQYSHEYWKGVEAILTDKTGTKIAETSVKKSNPDSGLARLAEGLQNTKNGKTPQSIINRYA